MEDFLFVYRMEITGNEAARPAAQEQAVMKSWQDWLGAIAAQNKLVTAGSRLETAGKVIKPKSMITDGPYMEMKEAIGGYSIVKAESLAEAATMAQGCPILQAGGNVEVRQVAKMDAGS